MPEQNRNTLKKALRKLPQYIPHGSTWAAISSTLMVGSGRADSENISDPLSEAINQLKTYRPDDTLFDDVLDEVGKAQARHIHTGNLKGALQELPDYSAPGFIWKNIELALSGRRRRVIFRLMSAAAVVALLIYAGFVGANKKVQYAYSEEIVTDAIDLHHWDADEGALAAILVFCEEQILICEDDTFVQLQSELRFLGESKNALLSALNVFEPEQHHIAALTKIELERSELLNQMARITYLN